MKHKIATLHGFLKIIKKFPNYFTCISINHDFPVITLRMHWLTLTTFFDDMNFTFIVSWIFHLQSALKSSIILPKYGLIPLMYCSVDSSSPSSLSCSIYLSSKTLAIFFWFVVFGFVVIYFFFQKASWIFPQHCFQTLSQDRTESRQNQENV